MKPLAPVPLLALAALLAGCSPSSDEPSANPSVSSSPTSAAPSPSITEPSATPPSGGTNVEAFCSVVEDGRDLETDLGMSAISLNMQTALMNAVADDDPTAVAAIQAFGSVLVEGSGDVAVIYEGLLESTDDPVLERGIRLSIDLNRDFGVPLGMALAQVETVTEYTDLMTSFGEEMTPLLSDPADQEAIVYLDSFSVDNCGFPLSTSSG